MSECFKCKARPSGYCSDCLRKKIDQLRGVHTVADAFVQARSESAQQPANSCFHSGIIHGTCPRCGDFVT